MIYESPVDGLEIAEPVLSESDIKWNEWLAYLKKTFIDRASKQTKFYFETRKAHENDIQFVHVLIMETLRPQFMVCFLQ
jgi:hypothetical protein